MKPIVAPILMLLFSAGPVHAIRNGLPVPSPKYNAVGYLAPRCTATFITKNTVITAAHCIPQTHDLTVYTFTYTQKNGASETIPVTTKPEILTGYQPQELAIVRLEREATDIDLPDLLGDAPKTNVEGTLVGFGVTPSENNHNKLRGIVRVLGLANMDIGGGGPAPMIQITPKDKRSNHVPCEGDSGGPIFIDGKLAGILSFGIGEDPKDTSFSHLEPLTKCGKTAKAFYVPLYLYEGWIKSTLQKLDGGADKPQELPGKRKLATCEGFTIFSSDGRLFIDDGFEELPLRSVGKGKYENEYYTVERDQNSTVVVDRQSKARTPCGRLSTSRANDKTDLEVGGQKTYSKR